MTNKQHAGELTELLLRQIEHVLPKLKYSVYIQQILAWLRNFEDKEVELALDLLFYLEYIPFSELQARLNEQLHLLDIRFGRTTRYLFVPFAKYPKSGDIVMYLISKCELFIKMKREGRVEITLDLENYKVKHQVAIVYIDDFVGTGKSFHKWQKKNDTAKLWAKNPMPLETQAILAAIIMQDGKEFILYRYPEIEVFAEVRSKIFCKTHSPFNLTGNRSKLRSLCLKYGIDIASRRLSATKVEYFPFGYDKSEALIAFDYGTPNNSLPIIWSDNAWKPIFPRTATGRMKKATEIKTEAAFYLGLMHKLDISFDTDINLSINNDNITLSCRDDHSILVYLFLIDKHYSLLQICQVLGITIQELDKIISKGQSKLILDNRGELTKMGINFIAELKRVGNAFKFRNNDSLRIRDSNIFVPKSFRNMT